MTPRERDLAERVEAALPALRAAAEASDAAGEFHRPHIGTLREAGLLGLIVPAAYGGLGGGLRDLAAATFALGTACPSTALAYFYHCSSASRGLLGLEAIDTGLFTPAEAAPVRAFAERLLRKMGQQGMWLANFGSEQVKSSQSAITITTEAAPVADGWRLSGVKAYGCSTGVADEYLVTARIAGTSGADGIGLFFVPRDAPGVKERARWDALGMRGSATHGIVLEDVFVPADEALAIPGAFTRMLQMSRGSFVGNQLAVAAIYLGIAQGVYDYTLDYLGGLKFQDTGQPIAAESGFHQELIGRMSVDLETGFLWLRRQIELETSDPPLRPKPAVVRQWRLCKGVVCDAAFEVAVAALKACGTSNTGNHGVIARGLRDLSMGLVQAFPAERGRLEAAKMIVAGDGQALFSTAR
ncbi:MAG: acyl-CoA/acyl-ACP dehydrogenase [Chloroflexales bacterium]|nr:acyl-CoA/acyl-ACP dehydrogenase [Chloroflexales bacterium]